jgi:hypothetical protein
VERKPAAKRDRDLLEKARLIPEEDGRRIKAGAKGGATKDQVRNS